MIQTLQLAGGLEFGTSNLVFLTAVRQVILDL